MPSDLERLAAEPSTRVTGAAVKAVDTKVLVRLLTRDDPEQAVMAAEEMRAGPIYVSTTVLMETAPR